MERYRKVTTVASSGFDPLPASEAALMKKASLSSAPPPLFPMSIMHLSSKIFSLALFVLALGTVNTAAPSVAPGGDETAAVGADEPPAYIMSHEEMMHWLATTDADVTYVGKPFNPLEAPSPDETVVTYCNRRIDNICGGSCRTYRGGPTCLIALGTQCIAATQNIGYCTNFRCSTACNELDDCRTPLANGFCFTPGTRAIDVEP